MKGKQGTKGFTDGAVVSLDNDLFDVEKYINGLSSFIEKCETPMTIAIQGDWGSGKTSVMNMVKEKLDKNNIIPVWFNTWKFSQFNMEEQLPVTFLSYLLKELSAGLSDKFQKRVERTVKTIGKLAFMSANVAADLFAGGMPEAINDAKEEMFSKNSIDTIDSLKSDFQNTISELLEGKGDGSRVVIFIDDLDRLRPGLAVGLLEILKIFLDCDKCVYVLAVDYEVVVQGIKEKYNGNLDGQKGRKFFDKIIQVPFKMPVAHYNIDNYVNKALEEIGVETGGDVRDYTEIITYSAGCNPRTMKRLFNAYLLLSNVYEGSPVIENSYEQKLLFACLCLQMSYEEIYNYIVLDLNSADTDKSIDNSFFAQMLDAQDIKGFVETGNYQDFTDTASEAAERNDFDIKDLYMFMRCFAKLLLDNNGNVPEINIDKLSHVLQMTAVTSGAVKSNNIAGKGVRYAKEYKGEFKERRLDDPGIESFNSCKIGYFIIDGKKTEKEKITFAEFFKEALDYAYKNNTKGFIKLRNDAINLVSTYSSNDTKKNLLIKIYKDLKLDIGVIIISMQEAKNKED